MNISGHKSVVFCTRVAWVCLVCLLLCREEGSKRHILHAVELSQGSGPITVFWASQQYGHAGWLAMLLIKAGDVETNPGVHLLRAGCVAMIVRSPRVVAALMSNESA